MFYALAKASCTRRWVMPSLRVTVDSPSFVEKVTRNMLSTPLSSKMKVELYLYPMLHIGSGVPSLLKQLRDLTATTIKPHDAGLVYHSGMKQSGRCERRVAIWE